jgi:alcohol-forming fatty acyl-CoA reductase
MKYPSNPMHPLKTVQETIDDFKKKDTPLNAPRIPEFYAGQEIFITGGSGFIGKVLIEKLLRSCPDVKAIYLLLRPKKGVEVEERLKEITDMPLFDVLRDVYPKFQEKLFPVAGDIAKLKLGMSEEDIDRTKNASIIFHSAASVRFDDSLKYAVLMNTRGTREVMEFATNLQHLKVVVHVSTTYSNVYIHTLEEKIYPAAADWRKTIEICEKMDENQLEHFTQHYIGFMPNTYVFSKNLAEHVSEDYKEKLPVVLFRPSVVIGAFKEPLPGKSNL